MKLFFWIIMFFIAGVNMCLGIDVDPAKCAIVIPASANSVVQFAASELQKHLELIGSKPIPILVLNQLKPQPEDIFIFYVGIPAPEDNKPLALEEARRKITSNAAWIYGDDWILKDNPQNAKSVVTGQFVRTGTMHAVYTLLEDQFGVKWICPGDTGIVYQAQSVFVFNEESSVWKPELTFRTIETYFSPRWYGQNRSEIPQALQVSNEEFKRMYEDSSVWLKRMRMGNSVNLFFGGHAFGAWWNKYGKAHPEYFALNEKGQREPLNKNLPEFIKMCVSNPDLPKAIADDWGKSINRNRNIYELVRLISTCENDGGGYCSCQNCRKLDVNGYYSTSVAGIPGKKEVSMTDRYVFFSNAVLAEAKKIDSRVKAVMYAYSDYEQPPLREIVSPDTIIGTVPSMLNSVADTDAFYKKWRERGATEIFLRPNDQHCNTGMPMGFEKQMFDSFQVGIKNKIFGTDYDSLHNFWPVTGIADYILAKAIANPEKSFEYWENEYCSVFGPAKDDVKEYFAYWRKNVWEKRLMPNYKEIIEKGRYGNFNRGIMRDIGKYYQISDFDKTDDILANAAAKNLSEQQRNRIKELILANKHARLILETVAANGKNKLALSKKLLEFRIENKDNLNISWAILVSAEKRIGDLTGNTNAEKFHVFSDCAETPLFWFFQIDTKNVGLTENWQSTPAAQIHATWEPVQTNTNWENLDSSRTHQNLKDMLKNYDGIGWYAQELVIDKKWKGKEIFLFFEAVDESCWVYVNGKSIGERLFKNPDDWQTSFLMRIDQAIDWNLTEQNVIVRVEDKGGAGGIWKPVWLVTKDSKPISINR